MTAQDRGGREAECLGGSDEVAVAERQGLRPGDPCHVEPLDRADGDQDQPEPGPEEHQQHDHEEHEGQGVEHVDETHHHRVDTAAGIARHRAVGDADEEGDAGCDEADQERDPAGDEAAAEKVAPEHVGAEGKVEPSHRRLDGEAAPLRVPRHDRGGAEQVRARQVAQRPLVDRSGRRQGDPQDSILDPDRLGRHPHPEGEALNRRGDGLGARMGPERGRGAHEVGIDPAGIVAGEQGTDEAGKGDQRQDGEGRQRAPIAGEAPERAPHRAARRRGSRSAERRSATRFRAMTKSATSTTVPITSV
ncbi:hypothetical protein CFIICLFH_4747 [Methylobacterium goesingense]|nr:hypothetical protein CFIICLFH_4747 [Methylobacterium goesingense]